MVVDWIHLVQNMDLQQAPSDVVMSLESKK